MQSEAGLESWKNFGFVVKKDEGSEEDLKALESRSDSLRVEEKESFGQLQRR